MSFYFPVPPIPYWLWKRYLLMRDEGIDVGAIEGMNYIGSGVVAQRIPLLSQYGVATVTNYQNYTPPPYPDGVWFSINGSLPLSEVPAASATSLYISDAIADITFDTSHPEWYEWDTDRVYSYNSGTWRGAAAYWNIEVNTAFDDDELCSTPTIKSKRFGIKIDMHLWTSPTSPSASTYNSLGHYDYQLAGCSDQTVGPSTDSYYKMTKDEVGTQVVYLPVYPGFLKLFYRGFGSTAVINSTTTFTIKFTNYPYFHIQPEYQT